jgi:thiamine pyrophosphate-dependent acetolactate synthase large subunit-like protein
VVEALRQHGLRFVLVRNESAVVFIADVIARLTSKPGGSHYITAKFTS